MSTLCNCNINNLLPNYLHFFEVFLKIAIHNLEKFIIKLKNRINRAVEATFYIKIKK